MQAPPVWLTTGLTRAGWRWVRILSDKHAAIMAIAPPVKKA